MTAEPDLAHCVLLAFIPIVPKEVPLAKPDGFKWMKLDDTFTAALTVTPELNWGGLWHCGMPQKMFFGRLWVTQSSPQNPHLLLATRNPRPKASFRQRKARNRLDDCPPARVGISKYQEPRPRYLRGAKSEGVQGFCSKSQSSTIGYSYPRASFRNGGLYAAHTSA